MDLHRKPPDVREATRNRHAGREALDGFKRTAAHPEDLGERFVKGIACEQAHLRGQFAARF